MLEIKNITKTYQTDSYVQKALDNVSIQFRESEFVSILGPSGSGKTTLLNIIGGLDHYDTGDLMIDGVSTKDYKDRDWDAYRNHRIGFVFQSYNLISHQSILANVELALTLSGVGKSERRKRATEALEQVGLGEHIHKRPAQLSGGQMQRVAIARALVNNPDILLADEPTGALDSETSVQIMELIKEISKDKLVIMVTHNPELAYEYSSRIVQVKDGHIIDDSDPYVAESIVPKESQTSKTSMGLWTALALSLNNLMSKKGRTILTAFAGSIGIIGIALILSLSSGVNTYITDVQKDAMLSYPISIDAESFDLSSFIEADSNSNGEEVDHGTDAVYGNTLSIFEQNAITMGTTQNNLTEFKTYLEDSSSEIHDYVGENGIVYAYATSFNLYGKDTDGHYINSDGSSFESDSATRSGSPFASSVSPLAASAQSGVSTSELLTKDEELVSSAVQSSYDVVEGKWPEAYDEVVLVLNQNNEIAATDLYNLGLLPSEDYKKILKEIKDNEDVELETASVSYEDVLNHELRLVTASDYYQKADNGTFASIDTNDEEAVEKVIKDKGLTLKIVGIVKSVDDSETNLIPGSLGYSSLLTDWIIDHTDDSAVVKAQEKDEKTNVLTGLSFSVSSDEDKAKEAKKYMTNLSNEEKASLAETFLLQSNPAMAEQISSLSQDQLAEQLDTYLETAEQEVLIGFYDTSLSSGTYEDNLSQFGKVNRDTPSGINIYADSFEAKEGIQKAIENYNKGVSEDKQITYTDYVGLLMSSITTIIDVITYVLIAFVSISLVVSSIMIAIITYISVLERTKEIGILRAVGASKRDVVNVFNAETFIEGLISGVLGIVVTVLLNIPINMVIKQFIDVDKNLASLPLAGGIILVFISVILTVLAGLIPSRLAAKKDPVTALRSE